MNNAIPAIIGAPAIAALRNKGITQLIHLTKYSEREVSAMPGVGPLVATKLRKILAEKSLSFR